MTMSTAEKLEPEMPPGEDELPCSDGVPMETERHRRQMLVLIESLELAWRDRDDFYVGGDMFVYFSAEQVRHNSFRGPDVFVVLDTVRRERKSWVVWAEGRSPDVVIELVSESTERVDRGEKMTVYARQLRVPVYVIFDPLSGALDAFLLDHKKRRYNPLPRDAEGRIEVAALDLLLGLHPTRVGTVDAPMLRWIDREGHVLPLEGERADEERLRADEERLRADEERLRADALAAKLAEYERRFGALTTD